MEKILLDTDVIIDFLRTKQGLLRKLLTLQKSGKVDIYLSSVSIFELFAGQSSKKDKEYILSLLSTLNIIPFDLNIAKLAGETKRDYKLSVALADFFIGVTSIYLGAKLTTRNKDHFQGIKRIKFFNPAKFAF